MTKGFINSLGLKKIDCGSFGFKRFKIVGFCSYKLANGQEYERGDIQLLEILAKTGDRLGYSNFEDYLVSGMRKLISFFQKGPMSEGGLHRLRFAPLLRYYHYYTCCENMDTCYGTEDFLIDIMCSSTT